MAHLGDRGTGSWSDVPFHNREEFAPGLAGADVVEPRILARQPSVGCRSSRSAVPLHGPVSKWTPVRGKRRLRFWCIDVIASSSYAAEQTYCRESDDLYRLAEASSGASRVFRLDVSEWMVD